MIKRNYIALVLALVFCAHICLAQEGADKIKTLESSIKASKSIIDAQPLFKELMEASIQENKFDELYNFLEALEKNKVFNKEPYLYYCKALTRFKQIQMLNDNKMWQELFDNKATYMEQLEKDVEKANKLNVQVNELSLRLKFLEVQINKDDENAFINELEELFNLSKTYAQSSSDVDIVKELADELSVNKQDIYARKLYNIYVSKIADMGLSEDALINIAEGFLKENKVDLAVSVYEVYLNKLAETSQDSGVTAKKMLDLAEKFRHQGWGEGKDSFFAEKIYEKANALYGAKAFDDISQYDRAYNLERTKEYGLCLQEYLKLVNDFPQYKEKGRIYFRIAVIDAYAFGNVDEAKKYLQKIVSEFPDSQDYCNSLYHLGLLDQWYNNLDMAKEKYQLILEKTKSYTEKPEITKMAETRLQEISEQKQIEFNLRTFLDAVLDEKQREKRQHLQLDLFVTNAKDYLNEKVKFTTSSYLTDTGCLQQDFSYLWSGNLGTNQNPFNNCEFDTDYKDNLGTKIVNVVLVDQSGIAGGTMEMADIYQK